MRQGYVIRKANQLNFSSSFRSVGHRASIWTYILTLCLEGLILIAGIVAAAILAAMLGCIGYGVSKIASYENYELFILLFAAPAAPILSLYILINLLIFSPTAYILVNNEGVSAGETIGACYRSMINNGKMTVFLTYFVSNLLKSLYLGAMGIGGYFVMGLIPENYLIITLIGWVIVTFAGYLLFAPILTLANRVVKEHLFEDIVLDPAVAARINEKVNVSVCNGKTVNAEAVNLASLFEYTEDPYRILELTERKSELFDVNPDGKKKRDKKLKVQREKPAETPQKVKTKKEGKPEVQPEPTVEARPEVQPEPVVEARPEVQPEPVVEEKPDVQSEPTVEARPESVPTVEAQPEVQPANQPLN